MYLKKIVIILLSLLIVIFVISMLFMLKEKNKLNILDKDINNYVIKKNELEEKNKNFDIEKEQVMNEINSNVNKDKLRIYEIWESQNKYLDDALK